MEKGSYQYSYTSRSPAAKQFEQEGKKKEVNKTRDALMKSNVRMQLKYLGSQTIENSHQQ